MFRLLTLLCVALFLALLIGGRDNGQVREGLRATPERSAAVAAPRAPAEPAAEVVLSSYVPFASPAPATPPAQAVAEPLAPSATAPEAIPESIPEATIAEPAPPVFSLDNPPVPADQPAAELAIATETETATTLRYVSATAINVRQGPSTDYSVIGRLLRDEAVSVVEVAADGWVRIRIQGDGIEGYVADRLLTDLAPSN